ncbi:MAG: GerW family sporulation protein [Syntrophales bacterium]
MEHVKMLIETLFSKLDALAGAKTVIGDAMEIKGKTMVPFIEICIGAGGGGFMGQGEGGGTDEKGRKGEGKGEGKGGGTGGCMRISPVAVVTVDESGGLCVYSLSQKKGLFGQITEMMPQLIEKIAEAKSKGKKE